LIFRGDEPFIPKTFTASPDYEAYKKAVEMIDFSVTEKYINSFVSFSFYRLNGNRNTFEDNR